MKKLLVIGAMAATALLAGCGATSGPSTRTEAPTAVSTPAPSPTVDSIAWASMISTDSTKLSTDLGAASTALGAGGLAAAETAVYTLAADVSAFQNDLTVNPAPPQFAKAAATILTALGDYSTGCQDFESGAANSDAGSIAAATTLFGQGNALLAAATSELGVG